MLATQPILALRHAFNLPDLWAVLARILPVPTPPEYDDPDPFSTEQPFLSDSWPRQ